MKCHFGELDESVLKALRDAYNPDANSFAESCDESFDFKQCQRSNGTMYGVPDKSSCAQKGSKEVKGQQGNTGDARKKVLSITQQSAKMTDAQTKSLESIASKMDEEALRNTMSLISKNIGSNKINALTAITVFARVRGEREAAQGKKVSSVSSVIPASKMKDLGLPPGTIDSLNAFVKKSASKVAAKPKPKPAIKKPTSWEDVRDQVISKAKAAGQTSLTAKQIEKIEGARQKEMDQLNAGIKALRGGKTDAQLMEEYRKFQAEDKKMGEEMARRHKAMNEMQARINNM